MLVVGVVFCLCWYRAVLTMCCNCLLLLLFVFVCRSCWFAMFCGDVVVVFA